MSTNRINLAASPYYDDFDEDKKFLRILFRPGKSVQARELTQLQTIQQKQIERFGKHMFVEGSMIVPGAIALDIDYKYVIINGTTTGNISITEDLILGASLESSIGIDTSKVKAKVVNVVQYKDIYNNVFFALYIKYSQFGLDSSSNTRYTFDPAETLTITALPDTQNDTSLLGTNISVASPDSSLGTSSLRLSIDNEEVHVPINGIGSAASIGSGVYFTRGFFVKVLEQTLILDPFSNNPSYRVGLDVVEVIVTENEDSTLLSNAKGANNYAASGAHRFKIDLNLKKIIIEDAEDPRQTVANSSDFIELLIVKQGFLYKKVIYTEYAEIEKTLARRTYDESGNYTVNPFYASVKNYLDDGTNNGLFKKYLILDSITSEGNIVPGNYIKQGSAEGKIAIYHPVTKYLYYYPVNDINFTPSSTEILNVYSDSSFTTSVSTAVITSSVGDDYENYIGVVLGPGKAYIKGHEAETIAPINLQVRKSRDKLSLNDNVIDTSIGNILYVKNLHGVVDTRYFPVINLYNNIYVNNSGSPENLGSKIGTARLRMVKFDSGNVGYVDNISDSVYGIITNSSIERKDSSYNEFGKYLLYLCDVTMNSLASFEDVKSLGLISSTGEVQFRADVICNLFQLTGRIDFDASAGTVTGNGTTFVTDLQVGNVIVVNPSLVNSISSKLSLKITAIADNNHLTVTKLDGSSTSSFSDFSNADFYQEYAELIDQGSDDLLFPAPYANICKFTNFDQTNTIDNAYSVRRFFGPLTSWTSGSDRYVTVALGINSDDENITSPTSDDVLVSKINSAGDSYIIPNIQIRNITTTSDPYHRVSFDILLGNTSDFDGNYNVVCTVQKGYKNSNSASYRIKTDNSYVKIFDSSLVDVSVDTLKLDHVDVYKIESILLKDSSGDYTIDITSRYTLDTGQRNSYYDYSSIIRKKTEPSTTSSIQVTYRYFGRDVNTIDKSYYCVNSYPNYESIPSYVSKEGVRYYLRDCLDFRPDISELNAVLPNYPRIELPVPDTNFSADYDVFLNRKDKVVLDDQLNFKIIEGTPAIDPREPSVPTNSMDLYTVSVPAYTYSSGDVTLDYIEHKRYTMDDIRNIDNRVKVLEEYTSLSLLEKDTADLSIKDSETGLDRFKLGFIVDSFKNATDNIGDRVNPDYSCSIDTSKGLIRPNFDSQDVTLEVDSNGTTCTITDDNVAIMPYTEVEFINQPYATYTSSVNPFDVHTFRGSIDLDPKFDTWKDTVKLEDSIVNVDTGNYDQLKQLTEQAGPIWNNWETSWSGYNEDTTVTSKKTKIGIEFKDIGTIYYDKPERAHDGDWILKKLNELRKKKKLAPITKLPHPRRDIYESRTTDTKTGSLSTIKSGVKLDVTDGTPILQNIGEKVVSVDQSTYMRSRIVEFTGKRMASNTVVYPFFDGKSVSDYCSTSLRTDIDTGIKHIDTSVSSYKVLKTDEKGVVHGYFELPENTFNVGSRIFRLTSSPDNTEITPVVGATVTKADGTYQASGITEKVQDTVLSIRNPEVISSPITDSSSVTLTDVDTTTQTLEGIWYDPVAETFLVESDGGAFISSIDIWFAKKPSENIPVELQIREVVNGYPSSSKIIPFGKVVLNQNQVTTVIYDPTSSDGSGDIITEASSPTNTKGDGSTTFKFSTPVYLQNKTEYCFVIISESKEYFIWVAESLIQSGEDETTAQNDILTPVAERGNILQKTVYTGSFFKSQNASTWEADQQIDIKFRINKAKFNTSSNSQLKLVNSFGNSDNRDLWKTLGSNPVQISQTSPTKLLVYFPNHGFNVGDLVSILNIENLEEETSPGIWASRVNFIDQEVRSIDIDSFFIINNNAVRYSESSSYSGRLGGVNILCKLQKKYDLLRTNINELEYTGTNIVYDITTREFKGSHLVSQTIASVEPNQNITFSTPKVILTDKNENTVGGKSLVIFADFNTQNVNVSPVIDLQQTSAIAVSNRVNNPVVSDDTFDLVEIIPTSPSKTIIFNSSDSTVTISNITADEVTLYNAKFAVGKYIKCVLSALNDVNKGLKLITNKKSISSGPSTYNYILTTSSDNGIYTQTASGVQVLQKDLFVEEIAPRGGSCVARFICKRMKLQNSANSLTIKIPYLIGTDSTIELYYKIQRVDDNRDFDDIEYHKVDPTVSMTASTSNEDVTEYTYDINGLEPFVAVAAKIVFKTDLENSSEDSYFTQFRMIAASS